MRRMNWSRKSGGNIEPFTEALAPIDHLDPEEMEKLKTACRSKRDRALLEWLRCTAMRKGEISSVNINQINWAERKSNHLRSERSCISNRMPWFSGGSLSAGIYRRTWTWYPKQPAVIYAFQGRYGTAIKQGRYLCRDSKDWSEIRAQSADIPASVP